LAVNFKTALGGVVTDKMKVAIETLGCKLNQAETESLARQFLKWGYQLVSRVDEADLHVLNTCTVTHIADAKSRHLLRLAHRRNPDALLVVSGCYAQRASSELSRIEGVSLVVGNDEKPRLLQILRELGHLDGQAPFEADPADYGSALRTRAFIKIQDGCSNFCSYCIVPLVRGRGKSLPVEQVVAEVEDRVADGCMEVVLTGTEVGSYSYDSIGLKGLLERILTDTDIARVRLSSLQPQEISPDFIGLWRNSRLCPHFHLSLQSGSDSVLRRMKRRYTTADYQRAVSLIRTMRPEAAITTDVIVGFPGETEAEFQESCDFCMRMGFSRIHVFPYSRRDGTEAAGLPSQVSNRVKKERSQRMLALAEESARSFRRQFLGKPMPVLWEKQNGGSVWSGHTDNYIKVYARSSADLANRLLPAKPVELKGDGVWGKIEKG
jgi:threonylcarbamoyladenosine tRNA methylthiotransferase MtaB